MVTAKYQPVRIRTTGMSWYVASVGLVCAWLGVLVFFPLWKIFAQVPDLAQQARSARPGASPAVARPLARPGARPLAVMFQGVHMPREGPKGQCELLLG